TGINAVNIGGICGNNAAAKFNNCYAICDIDCGIGANSIGGLVGVGSGAGMYNCYSASDIDCGTSSANIGGLLGKIGSGSLSTTCFWDTTVSNLTDGIGDRNPDPAGAIGKTTSEMEDINIYLNAGWDFLSEPNNGEEEYWYMPASSYPELTYLADAPFGTGTETDPYTIYGFSQFETFADPANASLYWNSDDYAKLMKDLDLRCKEYSTSVIAPDAIGSGYGFQGYSYNGIFDGNNKYVINLRFDTSGEANDYIGLFGMIQSSSKIENLILELEEIDAPNSSFVGGLVGYVYDGELSNCIVATGEISGYDRVGGIAGSNRGTINNCSSSAKVSGTSSVGGLVGNNNFRILNSAADGYVEGDTHVGGLIGYSSVSDDSATGYDTIIYNCSSS
ncbi:MAG: hypothetical protein MJE63_20580, partial [Proteobacteria bacterium]|nr:hypothetical protein [Pseudomonadota bacterium]